MVFAGSAGGVWNECQSGHTTVGRFGYYLDAQVSAAGVTPPTAAAIADAVVVLLVVVTMVEFVPRAPEARLIGTAFNDKAVPEISPLILAMSLSPSDGAGVTDAKTTS